MNSLKIAIAIVLLFGSVQLALAWGDATHASITNAAVQSVSVSYYPDVYRFADTIIENSMVLKPKLMLTAL